MIDPDGGKSYLSGLEPTQVDGYKNKTEDIAASEGTPAPGKPYRRAFYIFR